MTDAETESASYERAFLPAQGALDGIEQTART
jgi:hypothetical protein